MNLLVETIADIRQSGHTTSDIVFIGSRDGEYACTWDEFAALADQDYDEGYGAQRVAGDLIVRFSDGGWLERHEYDGSERWVYRAPFTPSERPKGIERVMEDWFHSGAYYGVAALHEEGDW